MNILILGGNGYIGSKLVIELLNQGHLIICTKRENSDMSRVQKVIDQVTFISSTREAVAQVMQHQKIDYVINTVGYYNRASNCNDTIIEANLEFPLKVLNLAAINRVKNFLTIGTGLPDEFNLYSFSKSIFAKFGKFYAEDISMNFVNCELQMFYGSDEPPGRFLIDCLKKMVCNESLNLTMGTQRRDIVAVEDVVKAIAYIVDIQPLGYQSVQVGTAEAPMISEVIEYMAECTNTKSKIRFGAIPMRPCEPNCIADISKLSGWGFKCKYSWRDGIKKMVEEVLEK